MAASGGRGGTRRQGEVCYEPPEMRRAVGKDAGKANHSQVVLICHY